MAEILNNQYSSVFVQDDGNLPNVHICGLSTIEDFIVTRTSIVDSIEKLDINTSGGIDNIPAWFYKNFPEQLSVPLQYIFAKSLSSGCIPKEWKMAIVSPVYKGNNKKLSDPASYRPVSLTCIACRLFERIIKDK